MWFRGSQYTDKKKSIVTRISNLTLINLSVVDARMLLYLSLDIRYLLKVNIEIWREYLTVQNRGGLYEVSRLNKNQIEERGNMGEDYIITKTLGLF